MCSYHIWVIPVARSSVGHNSILIVTIVVNDALQTLPGVLDVVEVSPQVAVFDDGGKVWLKKKRRGKKRFKFVCMYGCMYVVRIFLV